jgi:hypothetical protein
MSTVFLSKDIWPQLTKTVRASQRRCDVAVAYFGAGAGRLLPLPKGSCLVVDASDRAVASGQTCPADLSKLLKRGVTVYSVPNLHAKVFVVGRAAYIGSTNVSGRSESHLVEAAIRTTDPGAVQAARKFVQRHCLHELTPNVLKRLAKIYRPPRVPGGKRRKQQQVETSQRPSIPRVLLAQLHLEEWSDRDQALHDAAEVVATKRRKHPRGFELESFRQTGRCPFQRGDVVIQVTNEGHGRVLAAPPGNVLHVRTRRDRNRSVSFVYLERPVRRRRKINLVAQALGCTQKQLRRDGLIRKRAFAEALLSAWAVNA